ncbi:hypothetical protein [Bacteriophage Eos]|nr:hypothetical protein [Bacteriophage Eos]
MFHVYTDGGCRGNTRGADNVGAWAFVVYNSSQDNIGSKSGPKRMTTNNEMEMQAVYEALLWSNKNPGRPMTIYTDSTYTKNGCESWVWGWERKGWVKADGGEIQNLPLWQSIIAELRKYRLNHGEIPTFVKVKGHSGVEGNEAADNLLNVRMTELEMENM